jgi:hypothetical protein
MSAADPTPEPTPPKDRGGLRSYRGGRPKGVRNRPPPSHTEPEWARVPETAGRYRVSATKVKQWIKDDLVISAKVGNIRLVQLASVRRLLEAGST